MEAKIETHVIQIAVTDYFTSDQLLLCVFAILFKRQQ